MIDEENEAVDKVGTPLPNPDQHQSHGMTHSEVSELQRRQRDGLPIKMVPGNQAGDHIKDQYFQDYRDYQLPAHERGHVHLLAEARTFDSRTGVKLSIVILHKLTKEAYEFQKLHHAFDGQVVQIIHVPESLDGKPIGLI